MKISPAQNQPNSIWNILFVDDDEDDYILIKNMLFEAKSRKYKVHWASSFEEGRKALFSRPFDAVLVDYDLGLKSGIQLIREANERGISSPMILYTGRGNYEVDFEAMQAGATMYLTKGEVNTLFMERAIRYAVERKQTEEALRRSEEKFSSAFQHNPAAMTIIRISDSRYTDVNDSFSQMVGCSREEIIGHTGFELNFFSQEQIDEILNSYQRNEFHHLKEAPVRIKDGRKRHLLYSLDPIEVDGEPSILATMIDITERKSAEEALRQSENALRQSESRLRESLENTHDYFFSLNRDWQFTYANRQFCEIVRVDPKILIGNSFWEKFPEYLGTEAESNLFKVMREGQPIHFRQKIFGTNGTYDISIYPTHEGLAVFATDRSEETRKQQEILQRDNQLLASEERLKAVIENMPFGVIICTAEGSKFQWNYAAIHMHGFETHEDEILLQNKAEELFEILDLDGNLIPLDQWPIRRIQAGEVFQDTQLILRRKDISWQRTFSYSGTLIKDRASEKIGLLSILDISQEKLTKQELQESQQRLILSFEVSPNAIIISRQSDGLIENVNNGFERLFGYSRQEVIGKRSTDLRLFANPLDRIQASQRLEEEGVLRMFEIDILTKASELRNTLLSSTRLTVAGEKFLVTILVDITERKQMEEALKNSIVRERARANEMEILLDTVPAMIWISRDPECRKMIGNRYGFEFLNMWQGANISKTAPEEEIGHQPYRNFKDGKEIPVEELPMQVAAATGKASINYDFDLVFQDGTVRTVLGNVNPIFDESGSPSGAIAAFIDITDRKLVEEQLKHYTEELERSNQALQDFAFIASHDLQNPIRKILLLSNILMKRLKDVLDSQDQDTLDRLQQSAQRMKILIDGLLQLSRVNTGGAEFSIVNLQQVVSEVVSDLDTLLNSVGGKVIIQNLPSIQADALQMHQLFQNLLGNAIKFQRPGIPPEIRISSAASQVNGKPAVEVQVTDNGIGFDQQYAEDIFKPFRRLHGRDEYEGTGLGLAICQKIVVRHHGRIMVNSLPDKGTTFTILLPTTRQHR